jgi:hypothetical protein
MLKKALLATLATLGITVVAIWIVSVITGGSEDLNEGPVQSCSDPRVVDTLRVYEYQKVVEFIDQSFVQRILNHQFPTNIGPLGMNGNVLLCSASRNLRYSIQPLDNGKFRITTNDPFGPPEMIGPQNFEEGKAKVDAQRYRREAEWCKDVEEGKKRNTDFTNEEFKRRCDEARNFFQH